MAGCNQRVWWVWWGVVGCGRVQSKGVAGCNQRVWWGVVGCGRVQSKGVVGVVGCSRVWYGAIKGGKDISNGHIDFTCSFML